MTDRFTSPAYERWRIGLTARFTHYFTLNLEEKIRLAMDILYDIDDSWDHDHLLSYPKQMPSFDGYLTTIGKKLYGIRFKQPPSPALQGLPETSEVRFLGTLPFRSEQIDDPETTYDVSLWLSDQNQCERQSSACDTLMGLYYGSAEDDVTRFCPRHFYAMHFGPEAPYRFVDGCVGHPEK
jgi:hypothetical protein